MCRSAVPRFKEKLIMKKCLFLPFITLALLATFIFLGCGAKEAPVVEAPPLQETEEKPDTQDTAEQDLDKHSELSKETSEHEKQEAHKKPHLAEEETHHEAEPQEAMPMVEIPSGSVLHLIPEQAVSIIYCPSLAELDNRINTLATDLMPTVENPEVIAKILASTFGAGFESLSELEEIGIDLHQDFAIFMTALDPPDISAIVHLIEP